MKNFSPSGHNHKLKKNLFDTNPSLNPKISYTPSSPSPPPIFLKNIGHVAVAPPLPLSFPCLCSSSSERPREPNPTLMAFGHWYSNEENQRVKSSGYYHYFSSFMHQQDRDRSVISGETCRARQKYEKNPNI